MLAVMDEQQARLILQLSLPRVLPHQRTRVAARATEAIDVTQLGISGATSPGGEADWVVNDIEVDGSSQLEHKDLPGALFGYRGVASRRGLTVLTFSGLDPVERERELTLVVTYIGPNPEGAPFHGAALGLRPKQRPTVVSIARSAPLLVATKTTISVRMKSAPFKPDRLEIEDDVSSGGAADWLVSDLRINGRTQFNQPGDIPGDMFSTTAIDAFVTLETCEVGSTIEVDVIYVGLMVSSAIAARLKGTVIRDDYSSASPDLQVDIVIGDGEAVHAIARCDWRAPATDNRTL